LVATQGRPVQIAEIVAALGVPPPSAHRLAINLEERGMLQRALGSRKFVLGPAMVSLAFKALKSVMSDAKQRSILMALSGQISEQVEIAVVRENQVVFVETVKPVLRACRLPPEQKRRFTVRRPERSFCRAWRQRLGKSWSDHYRSTVIRKPQSLTLIVC
jgi:DNA-binding IclR family transcriptional regulator